MSLSINVNQLNYDNTSALDNGKGSEKERNPFFVGNSNIGKDPIEQKRKEAQQKALAAIQQAWDVDREIDKSIEERRVHYNETAQLKKEAFDEIKELNGREQALKEEYGISDDSDEQQDLELLKREQDMNANVSMDSLSKEEMEHLAELHENGLTEYQERALELNSYAGVRKLKMQEYDKQMQDDVMDIKSIMQERLKSNPMADAQKEADAIMEAASEEIIGMAMQEMKENIDEKAEEAAEKAEAISEEHEKEEERLDEIKEDRAIKEALMEGTKEAVEKAESQQKKNDAPDMDVNEMIQLTTLNSAGSDVQKTLDDIKSSMNMLEADLKGIKVDSEI